MFKFALKNMAIKKIKIFLIVISIVISASVAILSFNISQQIDDGIKSTAGYYGMIVGPSGSSTQLAMNTMFFTDKPLGTIPYEYMEKLQKNQNVSLAVPFTMGDSFNGSKIVGTTSEFLIGKSLDEGEMFDATYEAVIGSTVAEKYKLEIGSKMITSHGLSEGGHSHESTPLIVVGILDETKTAYDNVVFTQIETVWETHGHSETENNHEDEHEHEHGDICAILVKLKSPSGYDAVKSSLANDSSLLVINPNEVLREVLENVDMSTQIVYILCIIILIMNIFIISVITLLNMYDSKKEISLMRLIGVGMNKINLLYTIQNAIIGFISTLLALGISRLCLKLANNYVASMGVVLDISKIYGFEWLIMAVVFLISVFPTIVCTFYMSRKDGISE